MPQFAYHTDKLVVSQFLNLILSQLCYQIFQKVLHIVHILITHMLSTRQDINVAKIKNVTATRSSNPVAQGIRSNTFFPKTKHSLHTSISQQFTSLSLSFNFIIHKHKLVAASYQAIFTNQIILVQFIRYQTLTTTQRKKQSNLQCFQLQNFT